MREGEVRVKVGAGGRGQSRGGCGRERSGSRWVREGRVRVKVGAGGRGQGQGGCGR